MPDDRRKFERIHMPQETKVYVTTPEKHRVGPLRMLGRGGFQVLTDIPMEMGENHTVVICDDSESIRREVIGVVRNVSPGGLIGFEFLTLEPDAAVEIGVILGKYYSAANREP